MLSRQRLALGLAFGLAFGLALPAASPLAAEESSFAACETQQEMEQVIQSDGELLPDGCRMLSITSIETDVGELCVLDFEDPDPGVLDTLRDEVMATQWWVECGELSNR